MKPTHVKIKVIGKEGILEHFYITSEQWNLPAGKIEKEESTREAAARELLYRTGFLVKEKDLKEEGNEQDSNLIFSLFSVLKSKIKKVGEPGQYAGYKTKIRWRRIK